MQFEGLRPTICLQNLITQILKEFRDDGTNFRIVVHDQDLRTGRSSGYGPGALAVRHGLHVFPQEDECGADAPAKREQPPKSSLPEQPA
jgi:hypothetical protein